MSSILTNTNTEIMSVDRRVFPADAAHAAALRLLLVHDGSTTRLCQAVAQQPMRVVLHQQERTSEVLPEVREHLGGQHWLYRVTSLCTAEGLVMMDNLSLTRLDTVPEWFLQELEKGCAPIGHLLDALFVRREPKPTSAALHQALWQHVGLPDELSSRSYRIITPQGPLMLIFETFRAGLTGPVS